VPDSRQSLHVRCPGCSHAFQTRPGTREEAAPGSFSAGGKRPFAKVLLIAWAIAAVGGAAGVTYLLATDGGPAKTPAADEPAAPEPTGEVATPLTGPGETPDAPDGGSDIAPPPGPDGIDEGQYEKKPKPPKKPRRGGRKKGRGNRKNKTSQSDDGLKTTDISASRK